MKTYKFRVYPNTVQLSSLNEVLETHRRLYNDALAERITEWEERQEYVGYFNQCARLKDYRLSNPFLARTNCSSCQATLRRLETTFQAFFRRVKAGNKPGFPRFKGKRQFSTVVFPTHGNGCSLKGSRVYVQHVGQVKVKLHRPVVGKIKTVSFKRESGRWFVIFVCETEDTVPDPSTNPVVGIDLGLKTFLTGSDGIAVTTPKFFRKAQKSLRVAQRKLSRRKKDSKRRDKARILVARKHWHVANQRRDFHFKTAHKLVTNYGTIVHENLNIIGINRTRLAKSSLDAGWGQFLEILQYKAACAGVEVIAVDPRNTTQTCSQCGNIPEQKITLADRQYVCQSCGLSLDRDLNAAKNILRLGCSRQASTCRDAESVA